MRYLAPSDDDVAVVIAEQPLSERHQGAQRLEVFVAMSFTELPGTRLRFAVTEGQTQEQAEEYADFCAPLGPRGERWDWDWIWTRDRHVVRCRFAHRGDCETFASSVLLGVSAFRSGPLYAPESEDHTLTDEP